MSGVFIVKRRVSIRTLAEEIAILAECSLPGEWEGGGADIALGSAQLLFNGNYYFQPGLVSNQFSYHNEIFPTPGTLYGTTVGNLEGATEYRSFRMSNLYNPPGT